MSLTGDLAGSRTRVICGPTAAGKSAIAASFALEYGAAIISADSRQVYRGFDIGTAKPGWSERKSIVHFGVDIADPTERFSAARWAQMALGWIEQAQASGVAPLIVGGTGFYIRALFDPLFVAPEIDELKRKSLEYVLNPLPLDELRRWCRALDPDRSELGRYQLIRAIEIALLTGSRISDMHARESQVVALAPAYLLVDPGPSLAQKIENRVDAMIEAGWIDEVKALDIHHGPDAPAWKASGYRTLGKVVRGEMSLSAARESIIIETRQYAKRQRTWFRHQLGDAPVTRLDPDSPDCLAIAQRWWKENS